jgi:hypothetical protein
MAQTRAVLPARFVPLADELLATTGANDYSTLIGILLSRYGKHLLNTWEIANCPQGLSTTADRRIVDRTTRNVYTDGVLSMITDEDLVPFEFADFFDDEDSDDGDDAPQLPDNFAGLHLAPYPAHPALWR